MKYWPALIDSIDRFDFDFENLWLKKSKDANQDFYKVTAC